MTTTPQTGLRVGARLRARRLELGLTMAEAMALGKPVIATAYSGNVEFMSEANSYLVPYELVDVPSTWWAYEPGATWAEPNVGAAAELMRRVWEHPDEAQALGGRARDDLLVQLDEAAGG